jgi:hypothetical protein
MQFIELLRLRSDFEEITGGFNMPDGSDINTLKWFVENGHRSNSLRDGYRKAYEIAEAIVTEYENDQHENDRGFG